MPASLKRRIGPALTTHTKATPTSAPTKSSPLDDITPDETGLLIVCWLFFLLSFATIVYALFSDASSVWAILLFPAALYCADAISGISHFYLDYRRTTPDVGLRELYFYKGNKGCADYLKKRDAAMEKISSLEKVVFDFKTHHLSPGALARRKFMRLAAPMILFIGFPLALLSSLLFFLGWIGSVALIFICMFNLMLSLAQYAHSCAHRKKVSPFVAFLQKTRVFITADIHNVHHLNLGTDFCILSGIANPLVNRIFNFCRRKGWIFEDGLTPV